MKLRDINLNLSYSKERGDNIACDFYMPCVSSALRYDRATGYFGSTIYIIAWSCLKEFVSNGGKMRIICSPYLVSHDREAIAEGYGTDSKEKLIKEFEEIFGKSELSAPERVLACLIAMGVIDIKIAIGNEDPNRLFHDKIGIFSDEEDVVTFRGSMNETFKGLSDDGNFESIDVFKSWGDESESSRCKEIETEFERIWRNESNTVQTISLPDRILSIIESHARNIDNWTTALDETLVLIDEGKFWSADKRANGKRPRTHQLLALKNWEANGRRGIFEHATGSGKTFTAMCAIRKCLEEGCAVIVVVPSIGLMKQWKKELSETLNDMQIDFLLCGTGYNQWKESNRLNIYTQPNTGHNLIVVAVADTASSDQFVQKVFKSDKLLLVGDEVHSLGSTQRRNAFNIEASYRLGLSATPERYGDPEGTRAIIDYFGNILTPKYTLENAIKDKVLCPYFYYPNVVSLTPDEQIEWNDLSNKISRIVSRHQDDPTWSIQNDPHVQMLLIGRARVVKRAEGKFELAYNLIRNNYQDGQRWIVYCDNQEQMNEVRDRLKAITNKVLLYHSGMEDNVREAQLKFFSKVGGIIVSIKCLDEGIDIPETSHALILASSQNPREFIQRRGRILRRSPNKLLAYLYDAIVIPDDIEKTDNSTRIVETELTRAIQFGRWAEDPTCIYELKRIALYCGIEDSKIFNYGIESHE